MSGHGVGTPNRRARGCRSRVEPRRPSCASGRLGHVHVLIAPHSFGPLLPSTVATEHLEAGWLEARPDDRVEGLPMSDGSAGFLEALAPLGELDVLTVPAASGEPGPIGVVRTAAGAVYLTTESWNAPAARPDPTRANSRGLGEAIGRAITAGTRRIVLAAGDVPWHDGGTGLVEGLAATLGLERAGDPAASLPAGTAGADALAHLEAAARALAGVELVVAAQTDAPLLGLHGAGAGLAARGIDPARAQAIEARTTRFIAAAEALAARWAPRNLLATGGETNERRPSRRPSSGAGGGAAFVLGLLGARTLPGAWVVAEELRLSGAIARVDLVVTGARVLADRELSHGVVAEVGSRAEPHALPVVAIGGRIDATFRQLATVGVHGSYPVIDTGPGEVPDLEAITPQALRARAARVARSWSR
ncbi:hypothetical protein GCE65_06795 [Pseudactinotalea sp. HY158]|nr:hypothetical protein GCE65_06795 [Pseudactinotalea sp. HY158]